MALDEGQGRSSGGSDQTGQGLQWGAAPAEAPASPPKKKSSAGKASKEAQVRIHYAAADSFGFEAWDYRTPHGLPNA